jgi:molybdopterin molybdotransferase
MITVDEALKRVLDLFEALETETVPLAKAAGRTLAEPAIAKREQPPFASSAMDGYAVKSADLHTGATLQVIGESAAGGGFDHEIRTGQCVRIFTGAPVPTGADRILIQEDTTRDGDTITVAKNIDKGPYIRPAGGDFKIGDAISAPRVLHASDIALLASMNIPEVSVRRKPQIALVATGDELVMPGEDPAASQIISSNNFGLKALVESHGAEGRLLPIAKDTPESLRAVLDLAASADAIVTLGGASVGDHDLVGQVAGDAGLDLSFYKVAMRPGKPLMAGMLNGTPMIGLPGNPVSSMVCGQLFLIPAIRAMLGLGKAAIPRETANLGCDIAPNGPRAHFMRAELALQNGRLTCTPFERQDSSLLSVLARASCLMVRAPNEPARKAGETVEFIRI